MNHFRALFLFTVAFVTSGHALAEHTGDWISTTPAGESFKCRIVTTETEMENVLQRAGWAEHIRLPTIDWQKDEAVIVAPGLYHKSASLKFDSLVRKGNNLILYYEWESVDDGPTIITYPNGSQVTIMASRAPSSAETIVVSYKREPNPSLESCCRYKNSLHNGSCSPPTKP